MDFGRGEANQNIKTRPGFTGAQEEINADEAFTNKDYADRKIKGTNINIQPSHPQEKQGVEQDRFNGFIKM
jgi:hypothetical protein